MDKKTNPYAIRKLPIEIISVQTASLQDYAKRMIPDKYPGLPGKCLSGM